MDRRLTRLVDRGTIPVISGIVEHGHERHRECGSEQRPEQVSAMQKSFHGDSSPVETKLTIQKLQTP